MQPSAERSAPTPKPLSPLARIRHLDARRRTLSPILPSSNDPLFLRSLKWLWPWTRHNFPGLHICAVALFGRRVSWDAIRAWNAGRQVGPSWAAAILADTIEARCIAGLRLVEELRAHKGGPGRGGVPSGWNKVRKDGTTPRWRGGRPKRTETPD